jgi:two-component system sensor histidine kinase QseC
VNTIQQRLTFGLALACSLLWGGGGFTLYLIQRADLVAGFDQTLATEAEALATLTKQTRQGQVKLNFAGENMPAFGRAIQPDFFQLWRPDGSTLERSVSLRTNNLECRAGTLDAPVIWSLILPDGLPGRAIGISFPPQRSRRSTEPPMEGEMTLVVARHSGELDHRLWFLKTGFLLAGALLAGANIFFVRMVVRRQLQPLANLAARAKTIDAASLELRFPTETLPGELLPICQRLNDLLDRLEASFTRERRFTADVAHELRTPIAELRSLSEVALKYPGDGDSTKRALQDALEVALQMESVTASLLALARCEAGLLPPKLEPVDLAAMIKLLLPPFAAQAQARRQALSCEVSPGTCWMCDPAGLRVMLTNLLGNAIEYTPEDGAICLRVRQVGAHGQLSLANTTNHLGPEDLPHLFERFWRKDPARSSHFHSGLGLPLVKALAESMHMQLRVDLFRPDELTVTLSNIPLCPDHAGFSPVQTKELPASSSLPPAS